MLRVVVAAISIAVLAILAAPSGVGAAEIRVTTTTDEPGSNPTACSLREAVATANGNSPIGGCPHDGSTGTDVIRFDVNGVFPISFAVGGELIITENLTIVGNGPTQTDLDAQTTNRHFQVLSGVTVAISGVTMRNGRVIDTPVVDLVFETDGLGPGGYAPCVAFPFNQILNGPGEDDDQVEDSGHPLGGRGGAIFNLGNLTVTGSVFRENFAEKAGGAIYSFNRDGTTASLTVSQSEFAGNRTEPVPPDPEIEGADLGEGGAIMAAGCNPNVGNGARSTLTVSQSVFRDNSAASSGGAISTFGTETTGQITESTFFENESGSGGGAVIGQGIGLTIDRSTFENNVAGSSGGGLNAGDANGTTVTNSTFSGNRAGIEGGGIDASISKITLRHVTIASNTADFGGGGLHSFFIDHETRATIIAGNTSGFGGANCQADFPQTVTSGGFNIANDGSCVNLFTAGTDRSNTEPNLLAMADNGGLTRTRGLGPTSPARDLVTSGCPPPATDQRGVTRPREGNGDATPFCDSGAFELGLPGTLQFSAATSSINETGPTAPITVTRTGGDFGAVSATITFTNGTATATADYTATPIVVSFADTETSKIVQVPIVNDLLDEPDETVQLTLASPTGGATIGTQATHTLTIVDDDAAPVIGIAISDATETDAGNAVMTFTVTLSPVSGQTVTVQFATQDGPAPGGAVGGAACLPGVDYLTTSGTLTFLPSQTQQTIPVTVCSDALVEGAETFFVNLSNPTLATIADAQGRGTITDDDQGGIVSFTAAAASVPESAGSVTLTVQRTGSGPAGATRSVSTPANSAVGAGVPSGSIVPGGSVAPSASPSTTVGSGPIRPAALSAVTVNFATANVEAEAGQDYAASAGTIAFSVNETTKTIVIPIINDSLQEGPEHFTVVLSNPTGGAAIGPPAVVVVTIIDTTHGAPTPPGDDSADDEREERERETEEERRQRARTNQGNKDDDSVEGNVVETRCDPAWPAVVIANRDGNVEVKLIKEAQAACRSVQVGDYLEADGEKQHEQLFHADGVTIWRGGSRVR